jgi:hypothetical protein
LHLLSSGFKARFLRHHNALTASQLGLAAVVEEAVLGQTFLWWGQHSPYAVRAVLRVDLLLQARAFYGFQIAIENIHSGNQGLQVMISKSASCVVDSGMAPAAACAVLYPYVS